MHHTCWPAHTPPSCIKDFLNARLSVCGCQSVVVSDTLRTCGCCYVHASLPCAHMLSADGHNAWACLATPVGTHCVPRTTCACSSRKHDRCGKPSWHEIAGPCLHTELSLSLAPGNSAAIHQCRSGVPGQAITDGIKSCA